MRYVDYCEPTFVSINNFEIEHCIKIKLYRVQKTCKKSTATLLLTFLLHKKCQTFLFYILLKFVLKRSNDCCYF